MKNLTQQLPIDHIDSKSLANEPIALPMAGENRLFLQARYVFI